MKKIKISIFAGAYEEISKVNISNNDLEPLIDEFINENKVLIVKNFLSEMKEGVKINFSGRKEDKRKGAYPLFKEYEGNLRFDGVVGVIESILEVELSDEAYKHGSSIRENHEIQKLNLDIRLQIRSKFDTEKPYFLATMLLRNKIELNDLVFSNEEDIYDYLLLFWYKTKLLAAYEKGFYKTYRRFEENGYRLRGSINISQHIKLNIGQNNGKIAHIYRENTINNYLNHLIIVTYEYLKKKYPELIEQNIDNDLNIRCILEGIRNEIGYNPMGIQFLIKNNQKTISHPYFIEYEDLREICLKILREEALSIWEAGKERTKSILFYIPDLWELYLEDILKSDKEIEKDVYTQGEIPKSDEQLEKEQLQIFGNYNETENEKFTKAIYPDFIFFDKENPYFILDAKFKEGWKKSIKGKIPDFGLEDYSKCIRDMNSINAHATGVIFPVNIEQGDDINYSDLKKLQHSISKYNQWDCFYTIPVYIPDTKNNLDEIGILTYLDWRKEFDLNVSNALKIIKEIINVEKKYSGDFRKHMSKFDILRKYIGN
jgi:hypothetical protein